jgi:hypothetical protein
MLQGPSLSPWIVRERLHQSGRLESSLLSIIRRIWTIRFAVRLLPLSQQHQQINSRPLESIKPRYLGSSFCKTTSDSAVQCTRRRLAAEIRPCSPKRHLGSDFVYSSTRLSLDYCPSSARAEPTRRSGRTSRSPKCRKPLPTVVECR